jgi:integrase
MQPESSHERGKRQHIAPNLYRRRTASGNRFDAAFRDTDGRLRFKVLDARNETEAKRLVRQLLAQRDRGERVTPAAVTFGDFVHTEYVSGIEALAAAGRRSQRGVKLDKDHLRLYLLPALGVHRLATITGADVAGLLRAMRKRGLSESTLHHALTVLGAVFRLARARRIITTSPLDELDSGERPRRRAKTTGHRLDEAELALLVAHADETYRTAIALLAYTGCRISEALALRWQDVDLVDAELNVGGQLTRATRDTAARIVPRKGGADPYAAVVFPALSEALTAHLERELARGRGRDGDFLLATRTGLPLSQRNVGRALAQAAEAAGLGKVAPHDLRRSFCSLAARRGVDPVQAARMTGHSLDVFTRVYAGDYGKAQRDEARTRMLAHGFGGPVSEAVSTAPIEADRAES